jgi:hypothetical protein
MVELAWIGSRRDRAKSLEVLIPILYLKGVSTGDFEEALLALLGVRGAEADGSKTEP